MRYFNLVVVLLFSGHLVQRVVLLSFFFFFSSRRRHTRWPRDWSSDVCSSDLSLADGGATPRRRPVDRAVAEFGHQVAAAALRHHLRDCRIGVAEIAEMARVDRSEGRRVGKRGRLSGGGWDEKAEVVTEARQAC